MSKGRAQSGNNAEATLDDFESSFMLNLHAAL